MQINKLALISLLLMPSRSLKLYGKKNALGVCQPPLLSHPAEGWVDDFRGWYDVQGCGRCNDYCRWVGAAVLGPSGDPADPATELKREDAAGRKAWWSCSLAGVDRYTPAGDPTGVDNQYAVWADNHDAWEGYVRCAAEGAPYPPAATQSAYAPGSRGAAWTVEEMLVVRAKLHRVITDGLRVAKDLYEDESLVNILPNPAATMLRLGFHDCLKYADEPSDGFINGCDGCLEWTGVGHRFATEELTHGLLPADAASDGHNNGLGDLVRVLEAIYTQPEFPLRTPHLGTSLRQRGKSRADLWAFATLVAVEFSLDLNNRACQDETTFQRWPWNQCHPRNGEPDCQVQAPAHGFLRFKTGRIDCRGGVDGLGYATSSQEVHPDPESTGAGTVEFFHENFGFSGRETVAIMGGHTLGQLNVHHSLFRYTWKTASGKLLNNGYFRNLAKKHDWYYPSENEVACKRVGDAQGNRPQARWMPHVRGDTVIGGPVQWIQEKLVCGNYDNASIAVDTCDESDLEWKFVKGIDETVLQCEMGLYFSFGLDDDNNPTGCHGLEDFTQEMRGGFIVRNPDYGREFVNSRHKWTWVGDERVEPECPLTDLSDYDYVQAPLHEIVESFARSNAAWLEVFYPTLQKMLANGYEQTLEYAPDDGMDDRVVCPFPDADDIYHGRHLFDCYRAS